MHLPTLDISYIIQLVFTYNVFKIHPCWIMYQYWILSIFGVYISTSFLFNTSHFFILQLTDIAEYQSTEWIYHILIWIYHIQVVSILSTIINNAIMNICVTVFVETHVFNSLGNEIAGLYVNSVFNFLNNCQPVFKSNCTFYMPSGNVWGVQLLYSPHQWVLLSIFFIVTILVGVMVFFLRFSLRFT